MKLSRNTFPFRVSCTVVIDLHLTATRHSSVTGSDGLRWPLDRKLQIRSIGYEERVHRAGYYMNEYRNMYKIET